MASEFADCHKCGARLVRAEHIRFGKLGDHAESHERGFSIGADYGWRQNPCPKCGEAEPIRPKFVFYLFGLVVLAFVAAIVWVMFFLQPS